MLFVFLDFLKVVVFKFEVAEENIKITMLVVILIIAIIKNLKCTHSECVVCLPWMNLLINNSYRTLINTELSFSLHARRIIQ